MNHDVIDTNYRNRFIRFSNLARHFANFLVITLCAAAMNLQAADPTTQPTTAVTQQSFASSDEAINALRATVRAKDKAALAEIFGPDVHELLTGDEVQDADNAKGFAAVMAQNCNPVKEGDDRITLELGSNNWPMPIPLVKANGQWHFDTAAGEEEIINRHIGKDELHAIGVCRSYVTAQRQFAGSSPEGHYALKFKSDPGQKNGLYWQVAGNEPASPFGPLVAEAHIEGYGNHGGSGPHPFHGYYFRILTRQGKEAPGGKMNYLSHGNLSGGFALVAYPEQWDKSGIMTFIVNQDGKVYQRNFGENTHRVAGRMKEYNPDSDWMVIPDDGVLSAVLEK